MQKQGCKFAWESSRFTQFFEALHRPLLQLFIIQLFHYFLLKQLTDYGWVHDLPEVRRRTNCSCLWPKFRGGGAWAMLHDRTRPMTPSSCSTYTPSQWKRPRRRPRNSWLSVVSNDMEGVGITDAMFLADDQMRWKRAVSERATPQEGMLPKWLTFRFSRLSSRSTWSTIKSLASILDTLFEYTLYLREYLLV